MGKWGGGDGGIETSKKCGKRGNGRKMEKISEKLKRVNGETLMKIKGCAQEKRPGKRG